MAESRYEVVPVGWVKSPLTEIAQAPMQADEGAPPAWLVPALPARAWERCPRLRRPALAPRSPWPAGVAYWLVVWLAARPVWQ